MNGDKDGPLATHEGASNEGGVRKFMICNHAKIPVFKKINIIVVVRVGVEAYP